MTKKALLKRIEALESYLGLAYVESDDFSYCLPTAYGIMKDFEKLVEQSKIKK